MIKKSIKYFCGLLLLINFMNCEDGNVVIEEAVYSNIIFLPNIHEKNFNEDMQIQVNFESANQETIHYISVKIFPRNDSTHIVYSKPDDNHVQESSGILQFDDTFMLSAENGIVPNSFYTISSKIWGPVLSDNEEEKIVRSVDFYVGD